MSNITCYTCITGGKDELIEEQNKGDATFIAFSDRPELSATWEMRKAYDLFKDDRRNSRIQKILADEYIDTEYSIYIDGNMKLNVPPEQLIEKYLSDCDIAMYKHPNRDCLYDEAMQCAKMKLDDPELIIEQAKHYEDSGYSKKKGLCECGIILRRHTPKVEEFNNAWWAEFCRYSKRDQLSCMYAVDKTGVELKAIPDYFLVTGPDSARKQSGDVEVITHKK